MEEDFQLDEYDPIIIECHCGWKGTEDELDEYTYDDDRYAEHFCPNCEKRIDLY